MSDQARSEVEGGTWVAIGDVPDSSQGGEMRTVKCHGHALVVGRDADGRVFALDNRCPHEGYPLATGTLQGNALTCCWHNWKFDVRDGECVLGGEAVRRFDVRESDGVVEVDVSDPDPEVVVRDALASLRQAIFEHDNGRALRDAVRILETGYDAHRLLAEIAAYDAEHAEYGTSHVLAVASDCGRVLRRESERYAGVNAVEAIAPAIDMCGEANRRLGPRTQPEPLPDASGDELRAAVESEDAVRAEALMLGAFDAGVPRDEIERWLFAILSDHFLDFGHELIYLIKAQELLDRVGDEYARRIYPALLYAIVLGTREDTLPYMAGYARRLTAIEARLPEVFARTRVGSARPAFDSAAFRDAVLDGKTIEAAFEALRAPLEAGVAPEELARALVAAAAHRLWRFDLAVDRDPTVVETWLWATHRFTFASAVRNAIDRFDSPDALRFLFQAVAFIHSGRRMDRPVTEHALAAGVPSTAPEVIAAIAARDPNLAVARTRGYVESGGSLRELRERVEDACLDDPRVRPIVVAHAIKTAWCGFEEYDALADHPDRPFALLATIRFLASPIVERRVREAAVRSIRWVADGTMPAKLTQ